LTEGSGGTPSSPWVSWVSTRPLTLTSTIDVFTIPKIKKNYRVLIDVKGRFIVREINAKQAQFKLCRIVKRSMGKNRIPYIVTHDGRTLRYPTPDLNVLDTIKLNLKTGAVMGTYRFESGKPPLLVPLTDPLGNIAYITGGNNIGRVGVITHRVRHKGGFDIVHIKDAQGKKFATRLSNVFIIGTGDKPEIKLAKDQGLYLTALEKY